MSTNDRLENQPVGSGERVVQQGECVDSIAFEAGHFWEKIWNHPSNSRLKAVRKDPNTLLPGDRVHVPPIEVKEEARPTEARHRFRLKGALSKLCIRCMHMDEPLRNLPYRIDIDGRIVKGVTSPEGLVEEPIPPNARRAFLIVQRDSREFRYDLALGHLDPLETTSGVKSRLANLGFSPGPIDDKDTPEFCEALRGFQEKHGLQLTGKPDPPTLSKLDEINS
jgi:hypothetical protein